jgi:hypothetical protein
MAFQFSFWRLEADILVLKPTSCHGTSHHHHSNFENVPQITSATPHFERLLVFCYQPKTDF